MVTNTSIDIKTLGRHVKARNLILYVISFTDTKINMIYSVLSNVWASLLGWFVALVII